MVFSGDNSDVFFKLRFHVEEFGIFIEISECFAGDSFALTGQNVVFFSRNNLGSSIKPLYNW